MSDGIRLSANVFRPEQADGPLPVILALTPYGKDADPEKTRAATLERRTAIGLGMGRYRVSNCTPFEAPDPAYWVPHGYAVVHVDLRGCFKSQGERKVFSRTEINDYGQIIEWAGYAAVEQRPGRPARGVVPRDLPVARRGEQPAAPGGDRAVGRRIRLVPQRHVPRRSAGDGVLSRLVARDGRREGRGAEGPEPHARSFRRCRATCRTSLRSACRR